MAKVYQKNLNNEMLSPEARERWWVDYTGNDGVRRRISVGTKKAAEDFKKTVEGDKVRGLLKIADDKSERYVSDLINEYIDERLKDSSNEKSFNALRWLAKELKGIKLKNLTDKFIMAKRTEWLKRPGRAEKRPKKGE